MDLSQGSRKDVRASDVTLNLLGGDDESEPSSEEINFQDNEINEEGMGTEDVITVPESKVATQKKRKPKRRGGSQHSKASLASSASNANSAASYSGLSKSQSIAMSNGSAGGEAETAGELIKAGLEGRVPAREFQEKVGDQIESSEANAKVFQKKKIAKSKFAGDVEQTLSEQVSNTFDGHSSAARVEPTGKAKNDSRGGSSSEDETRKRSTGSGGGGRKVKNDSDSDDSRSRDCYCNEVLVADDNDFNLFTFQEMLKIYGVESSGACNGLDALEKVQEQMQCCPFKVVFMDVNMPIMDGIESTNEILKFYKQYEKDKGLEAPLPLTIVALTANESEEEKKRCLRSGMHMFLSKPPEQEDLLDVLIKLIGRDKLELDDDEDGDD